MTMTTLDQAQAPSRAAPATERTRRPGLRRAGVRATTASLPVGDISLSNYPGVFDTVPAARFLANSIVITAVTVLVGLFVNSLAAFALSRMTWRGSTGVLGGVPPHPV